MRELGAILVAGLVTAAAAAAAEPEVLVLRGRPGPAPAAAPAADPSPATEPLALAGGRLWLVDRGRGRLVGCRLERTTQVGERRIRCAGRTLSGLGS